uniref:C2H2-type domain-containing protein n=1 Tax=viral metagenome TaxID=1070528 RepID=A0A6C0LHG9_9ZZZZ
MVQNGADLGAKKIQKEPEEYQCKKCDFFTCKLGNWKRHLNTKKHNGAEMVQKSVVTINKKSQTINADKFVCNCGKIYTYHQGYYRHKKTCNFDTINQKAIVIKESAKKEYTVSDVLKAMKENQKATIEQTKMIAEQTKMCTALMRENQELKSNIQHITNNNLQNIGTQNNTNIMLYLNNECGQAMSIQDFVDKLSLTISDLKHLKDDKPMAIADIVRQNLEPLALTERPLHNNHSDWFVKDKREGWQEDDGEKIVKNVEHGIIKHWPTVYEAEHPDWINSEKQQNEYVELSNATTSKMHARSKRKLKMKLAKDCIIKDD